MSVTELSASTQTYLKSLWVLQEWSDEPITASALAARAGVSLSSASDAVRKLAKQGLVDHTRYGAIQLSDTGRGYALEMVRRHRLLETFLVQVLDYSWDEVHDEAEILEHAISDRLLERIDAHLGHPARDPHGDPIPDGSGAIDLPATILLTDLDPGTRGRVERISDADPSLLQHLEQLGLTIGADVELAAGAPFSDAAQVQVVGGGSAPLGRAATDAVRVSVQR